MVEEKLISRSIIQGKPYHRRPQIWGKIQYQSDTLSLVESFIESEVPHLRLFLLKSMMPLKRWVATEKVLTALFPEGEMKINVSC